MEELKVKVLEARSGRVVVKLGRMRKPDSLLVMKTDKGNLIAQGSRIILKVDPATRKGVYNTKGSYFPHLSPVLGAKEAVFPEEFVKLLEEAVIKPGEILGYLDGAPVIFGGAEEI
ncbi:hypothetical protein DRP07_02255 [Archaeoglobales archaeon]|mgnify:CR=1 FL=1|nr:MAG: hypothetical protein DRP07_02255 [Archaeoglobales archaeon]